MNIPNEPEGNLESQLRDWGNRAPTANSGPILAFEELAQLRDRRHKRFQRVTSLSVMAGTVLLVSWIATLALEDDSSKFERKNSIAIVEEPQEIPEPILPSPLDAALPIQPVNYTDIEVADRDLQKRWLEAQRNNARDRVLEQWLAENM